MLPTISADGGRSRVAPNTTQPTPGDVQAGAVGPDGTTLFSQSTSFFNVFTGTAPGVDVFPVCSGCAESFAVDSAGLAQIAFWSNAAPDRAGYLYRPVASRSRI